MVENLLQRQGTFSAVSDAVAGLTRLIAEHVLSGDEAAMVELGFAGEFTRKTIGKGSGRTYCARFLHGEGIGRRAMMHVFAAYGATDLSANAIREAISSQQDSGRQAAIIREVAEELLPGLEAAAEAAREVGDDSLDGHVATVATCVSSSSVERTYDDVAGVKFDRYSQAKRFREMCAQYKVPRTIRASLVECDDETALSIFTEDDLIRAQADGTADLKMIFETAQAINRHYGPIIEKAERLEDLPHQVSRILETSEALRSARGKFAKEGVLGAPIIVALSGRVITKSNAEAAVRTLRGKVPTKSGRAIPITPRVVELKNAHVVQKFCDAVGESELTIEEQERLIDEKGAIDELSTLPSSTRLPLR